MKLARTLSRQVPQAISKQAFARLETEFEKAKQSLMQDFESHEVTRELSGGTNASNISNTLGGEGNLYAFIGFGGEDALSALRALLENGIKITNKKIDRKNLTFSISISIPDASQIASATPMPWAPGLSWAEGIEKGISGLGRFLSKESASSRSGKGVQLDFSIRQSEFSPKLYLTKILEDFVAALAKT